MIVKFSSIKLLKVFLFYSIAFRNFMFQHSFQKHSNTRIIVEVSYKRIFIKNTSLSKMLQCQLSRNELFSIAFVS